MTPFDPANLGLLEAGLPLLRDLVHERTGLHYDDGRCDIFAERLAPLVLERGLQSFFDLYYLLKYDQAATREWRTVMDVLSVQETYFWREMDQIRSLACTLMPRLVRDAAGNPVRIWSAPCSTGEEPLTIAIALAEAGWFDRCSIEIHATDGSTAAIAKARAGRYRERAFRSLPASMRDKYFVEQGDHWTPAPSLSARITSYRVVNLMNREEMAPFAGSQVVFCRNAFIYFSPGSIRRVTDALADLMATPGYLFVGASESLLRVTDRFSLEEIDRAFVYVKN
jgi:chemotaxis protein methyltransferase CheR